MKIMIRHQLILEVLLFLLKNLKDKQNKMHNRININKIMGQKRVTKKMNFMNKKISIINLIKFRQKNKKTNKLL
jgi:hypothetical protein